MTQKTLEDSGLIERDKAGRKEVIKPLWTGGITKVIKEND